MMTDHTGSLIELNGTRPCGEHHLRSPANPTLPCAAPECLTEIFPGLAYLQGRLTERSYQEYLRDARDYVAFCQGSPERARDPASLRAWRQWMVTDTGMSPHTINRRLIAIRSLVNASAQVEQFDPALAYRFRGVERVKLSALRHRLKPEARVRLDPQDVRQMCRLADASTLLGLRDHALLHTLATSGCRISEVVTLQRSAIVRQGEHWMIEVIGKGRHEARRAPLSQEAYDAIETWLRARAPQVDSRLIFTRCGRSGHTAMPQGLTPNGAWRRVRIIADAAGLGHVKPHDFRRFVGTELTEKKGLRVAQKVLGHVSVETTARHYVLDDLESGLTDGLY